MRKLLESTLVDFMLDLPKKMSAMSPQGRHTNNAQTLYVIRKKNKDPQKHSGELHLKRQMQ